MDELLGEHTVQSLIKSKEANIRNKTYNHVSNMIKSLNEQGKHNFDESSGASSPTSSIIHSSSSSLAAYNLSRNSSCTNAKEKDDYSTILSRKSLHSTSSLLNGHAVSSYLSNLSRTSFTKSQNKHETTTNVKRFNNNCSSTSSSSSNLNCIEDCVSSVFDDDLISNSSTKEKHALKSNRDSFSTTNNYEDFDEYETGSSHSSCNLSKLKMQQEETEFTQLVRDCQNWIEEISGKRFPYPNDFRKSLENGVIFCELLNLLKRDCIKRINRHSTPIAGIDNLNVFLKACQEHFNLVQSNLFDITDLEDFEKRRGTIDDNDFDRSIDEKHRRLRKVIQTVHWLSKKSSEFGISLPCYFDINNPNNTRNTNVRNSFLLKATHSTSTSTIPNNNKTCQKKNTSKEQNGLPYSKTSSSSSSPYFSSSSNSSLNQFSASSSISTSSSFTNSSSATNSASLSVIVSTSLTQHPPPISNNLISSSPASVNSNASSLNFLNKKNSFIEHELTSSDEIITSLSPSNSTSVYENCVDNTNVKVSQNKMSYIYKQQQLPQHKNNLTPLKINSNNSNESSHDDVSSGRMTNISSPGSSINGSGLVSPQVNNNSVQNIPTRYIDRRISTSAIPADPHKFNVKYSEVGLKIAKKAQDAIKKAKEVDANETPIETIIRRSDYAENGNGSGSGSGGGSASEDWQNSVDDWKQRRRQKKNLPSTSRLTQLGEEGFEDKPQKSDRKRINKFENSQYYISPIINDNDDENQNESGVSINNQVLVENQNVQNENNSVNFNSNDLNSFSNIKKGSATIEISGITTSANEQNSSESYKSSNSPVNKQNNNINNSMNQSINEEISDDVFNESDLTNKQYVYIEKYIEIDRPLNYAPRGFGFLLNSGQTSSPSSILIKENENITELCQNYAQIVVVEPETLASDAGLKKGDLVVKINDSETNNLSNDELRKIMRHRIKCNSINLVTLSKQLEEQTLIVQQKSNTQSDSTRNTPNPTKNGNSAHANEASLLPQVTDKYLTSTQSTRSITTITKPNMQQQPFDYHSIVAPKPFKKAFTTNQSELNDMDTTNSLIEKRKSQMNLILNWASSSSSVSTTLVTSSSSSYSPSNSLNMSDSLSTASNSFMSIHQNIRTLINNGTNLNEVENKSKNMPSEKFFPTQSGIEVKPTVIRSVSKEGNSILDKIHNSDDTDRDNDDESEENEMHLSPRSPPPVPMTEPPPLPATGSKVNNNEITKALLDNMKCVENWKIEQELLMKKKYEEEQKKIQMSLKFDLEKVKEEEIQRREQERLKLEKEKLRLQELELTQREQELKNSSCDRQFSPDLSTSHANIDCNALPKKAEVSVKKDDLNALIEKIYTEQNEEDDMSTDGNHKDSGKMSSSFDDSNSPRSLNGKANKTNKNFVKSNSIVMTKTSPLVAAAIGNDEDDEFSLILSDTSIKEKIKPQPSLIDNSIKHQIIKQVSDSMDNLKNELLNKGMEKFATDVDNISKNLESNKKKTEEMERIRREQDLIRKEKEIIEYEKEKLRQEAEQLRLERELILMTSTTSLTPPASSQNQSNHMSNIQSSSTSSTSSTIDQLDAGYGTMNDQQEFDSFKKCFNSSENLMNSQQSSTMYDNNSQRKFQINVVNKYNHQQQPDWVQEEAEQERMTQKFIQNSRNFGPETIFDQKLRRSTPNLLLDYNNQISLKNSNSNSYINNRLHDAGYMNPVVTSTTMTRIQPIQQTSQPQQKVRIVNNVLNNTNKSALPLTKSRHSNLLPPQNTNIYISAKPPQPNNHRLITSTSQGDLKNAHKLYSSQHQLKNHPFPIQSKFPMPTTNTQPPISLNQKCSNCSSVLGQGSAMFIEKLGLAFHLKCFRCSVCNIPLGNGKEGTDVRVSGANRLHCNNCFSNDLGNHIEINLVNNSQNNSFFSLNNLNNDEENHFKYNNQNCITNNNYDIRTSDDISYNIGNRITNYYDVLISSFSKKHIQLKSKLFDQHFILPNYFATKTNLSPSNVATSPSSSLSPHIINIQHF